MNKKYLNMVLIALLIFIWGSVVYKYFVKKAVDTADSNNIPVMASTNMDFTVTRDSFELVLNDKDPFGISKRRPNPIDVKKTSHIDLSKKLVPKNDTWPKISYYGFVRGQQKSTKLVLIKVNNKLSRKRETENIEEVSILKAYSDSVIVSYNKEHKTIQRIHEKN